MKKITMMVAGALCLLTTSCGGLGNLAGTNTNGGTSTSQNGSVLSDIFGAATNGKTVGNILGSVIGLDRLTPQQLIGTWKYSEPGCAFTSDNMLAKAGGEVAAQEIRQKLRSQYSKVGISPSNTYITFGEDGRFSGKMDGKTVAGTYTYNEKTGAVNLKMLLLNLNGYVKRSGSGISLLFESKKLLTLVQTVSAMSGNATLSSIGEISRNYDGVRLGFDMVK